MIFLKRIVFKIEKGGSLINYVKSTHIGIYDNKTLNY